MSTQTFTHTRASGLIETVYPDGTTRLDYPETERVGFPMGPDGMAWRDRYHHPRRFDADRIQYRRVSPRVAR